MSKRGSAVHRGVWFCCAIVGAAIVCAAIIGLAWPEWRRPFFHLVWRSLQDTVHAALGTTVLFIVLFGIVARVIAYLSKLPSRGQVMRDLDAFTRKITDPLFVVSTLIFLCAFVVFLMSNVYGDHERAKAAGSGIEFRYGNSADYVFFRPDQHDWPVRVKVQTSKPLNDACVWLTNVSKSDDPSWRPIEVRRKLPWWTADQAWMCHDVHHEEWFQLAVARDPAFFKQLPRKYSGLELMIDAERPFLADFSAVQPMLPGTYRVTVELDAARGIDKSATFEIQFDGNMHDFRMRQVPPK